MINWATMYKVAEHGLRMRGRLERGSPLCFFFFFLSLYGLFPPRSAPRLPVSEQSLLAAFLRWHKRLEQSCKQRGVCCSGGCIYASVCQ